MEPVAHDFHDEEAHDQRQQPLEPVRQYVNDDFLPGQDAEEIPDGASFDCMTSRYKRNQ